MTTAPRSQPPAPLQDALAWLQGKPAADPLRDLAPLLRNLREATDATRPPGQRLRLLGLFQVRAAALTNALKPSLMDATLPLLQRLRTIAQGLIDTHGLLASLTLRVAYDLQPINPPGFQDRLPALCISILRNLAERQQAALFVAGPPPMDLWSDVQSVWQLLGTLPDSAAMAAQRQLRAILALAAAQPESFTARELAFLADYLQRFAVTVDIRPRPTKPAEKWFWLEEGRDLPPVAVARRTPPAERTSFFFSCEVLAGRARGHASTQPGLHPDDSYSPPDDFRSTLQLAAEHWAAPPRRQAHRRAVHFRVEICASLDDLWQILEAGAGNGTGAPLPATTQWMVLNESPGSFGMMHVSGVISRLAAGNAVGMRMPGESSWTVCVIRWARSDNPEHLELGVEMISPAAISVRIAVPTAATGLQLLHALLLPPLPTLNRSETLLTSRGGYAHPRFTLMRESEGKLQLGECHTERLALQTASVEMFEFFRDFSAS